MGMPCQVNSILKLNQEYPTQLVLDETYQTTKSEYRIIPIDVPIPLVNQNWIAHADVIIDKLTWRNGKTEITYRIDRIYESPFSMKK